MKHNPNCMGFGSHEESNLIYFANGIIWKVESFIVIKCFFLFKRYNNYVPCELFKTKNYVGKLNFISNFNFDFPQYFKICTRVC